MTSAWLLKAVRDGFLQKSSLEQQLFFPNWRNYSEKFKFRVKHSILKTKTVLKNCFYVMIILYPNHIKRKKKSLWVKAYWFVCSPWKRGQNAHNKRYEIQKELNGVTAYMCW